MKLSLSYIQIEPSHLVILNAQLNTLMHTHSLTETHTSSHTQTHTQAHAHCLYRFPFIEAAEGNKLPYTHASSEP